MNPAAAVRHLLACCIAFSLAVVGAAGCGPGYTAMRGEDSSVFFPTLRIDHDIRPQEGGRKTALTAEFEGSRAAGSGHQTLGAGEQVLFAGQIFTGPADLQQSYTLQTASAMLRLRSDREQPFYVDLLFAGVRFTNLDLNLQSGGVSAQDVLGDVAAAAGIGIGSHLQERLSLDLRFTTDILPFNINRTRFMTTTDLFGTFRVTRTAAVTAGYRRWKYRLDGGNLSDINALAWQGFSAGLLFVF